MCPSLASVFPEKINFEQLKCSDHLCVMAVFIGITVDYCRPVIDRIAHCLTISLSYPPYPRQRNVV